MAELVQTSIRPMLLCPALRPVAELPYSLRCDLWPSVFPHSLCAAACDRASCLRPFALRPVAELLAAFRSTAERLPLPCSSQPVRQHCSAISNRFSQDGPIVVRHAMLGTISHCGSSTTIFLFPYKAAPLHLGVSRGQEPPTRSKKKNPSHSFLMCRSMERSICS